jgi:hypothetical protein
MEWECAQGHTWLARIDTVRTNGGWCLKCSHGKTQNMIEDIVKRLFPGLEIYSNYRKFDWLKDKGKLEIDIWIPFLKLAIEYDGAQHFQSIEHFGGKKN